MKPMRLAKLHIRGDEFVGALRARGVELLSGLSVSGMELRLYDVVCPSRVHQLLRDTSGRDMTIDAGKLRGALRGVVLLESSIGNQCTRGLRAGEMHFDKVHLGLRAYVADSVSPEQEENLHTAAERARAGASARLAKAAVADDVFALLKEAGKNVSELGVQVSDRGAELEIVLSIPLYTDMSTRRCYKSVRTSWAVLESAKAGMLSQLILEAYRELYMDWREERIKCLPRDEAKRVAYGAAYGAGPLSLNRVVGSIEEARAVFGAKEPPSVPVPTDYEATRREIFGACRVPKEYLEGPDRSSTSAVAQTLLRAAELEGQRVTKQLEATIDEQMLQITRPKYTPGPPRGLGEPELCVNCGKTYSQHISPDSHCPPSAVQLGPVGPERPRKVIGSTGTGPIYEGDSREKRFGKGQSQPGPTGPEPTEAESINPNAPTGPAEFVVHAALKHKLIKDGPPGGPRPDQTAPESAVRGNTQLNLREFRRAVQKLVRGGAVIVQEDSLGVCLSLGPRDTRDPEYFKARDAEPEFAFERRHPPYWRRRADATWDPEDIG